MIIRRGGALTALLLILAAVVRDLPPEGLFFGAGVCGLVAGLCGFSVSNLRLPGAERPWEEDFGRPGRIVSALDIMLEGPIGAAAFNNEFGRPNLCGYFRTFEEQVPGPDGPELRGYHKPIMLAGGVGNIQGRHVEKGDIPPGAQLIVLGGPAMLIGLGGGAASSSACTARMASAGARPAVSAKT